MTPLGPMGSVSPLNESLLDAMAEAALGVHALGKWEAVENGYQALCARCGMTTWVGPSGLRYSLLEDVCPGKSVGSDNVWLED